MGDAAMGCALFAVNVLLTIRLFRHDYIDQMGSIDGVFIGLARYIRDHVHDLTWYPLWYGGVPYPDTYPPLLHSLVAAVSGLGGVSIGLAYNMITAVCYALCPVALFWTAQRLGASRYSAFAGALLYSLISPACWLVREVRVDAGGLFAPRRLMVMAHYGEGPHIISMLFLILTIGLLHAALQKRRPLTTVCAGLAMAATVLSNWIGAFALALAVIAYLLAFRANWLRAAAIGLFAYAVAMPWAMPSTIRTIEVNAPLLVGFQSTLAHKIFVAGYGCGFLLLAWAVQRFGLAPRSRFAVLLFCGMAGIALPAYFFNLSLLPQPQRYHMEMDLAFWLGVALVMTWRPVVVVAAAAALCLPVLIHQYRVGLRMEKPIEIRSTAEYRISSWLGEHARGQRVFAPGTIGFWLDAFSDTAQLTGGFDNGMRNDLLHGVNYQIYAGDKTQTAVDWLKAFGCDAVVGDDVGSAETFHPYTHPERFHSLPELWRDGPEVIYAVPRARHSLAHALRSDDLLSRLPPVYDTASMGPFLAALDDPALPEATFEWRGMSAARITGDLKPEHLLYVQVTWDQGWRASVGGQPRATRPDLLGQMVIEPQCKGPCAVDLIYTGGAEWRIAHVASAVAVGSAALWLLLGIFGMMPKQLRSDATVSADVKLSRP
jgi:hypothetical protein